jgi:hypothetical protein
MANTLNGTIYTNIARKGFEYYLKRLIALKNFTTDFSAEVRDQGTSVQTRLYPAAGEVRDLNTDLSGNYSNAPRDFTTAPVTVNLDKHPIVAFSFTDEEYNRIGSGVFTDIVENMIRVKAYAIADSVLANAFALVKLAAFGSAVKSSSVANFDADDMADIRTAAVDGGWSGYLGNGAGAILSPPYYGALLKDPAIANYAASQSDALRSGELPNVYGFRTIEAPTLPHNDEHLVGFISTPDALAIALRPPKTQASSRFEAYEVLVDDVSGAVMVYAAVFNTSFRKIDHTFEVVHGAAKGNPQALKRIVGASGT